MPSRKLMEGTRMFSRAKYVKYTHNMLILILFSFAGFPSGMTVVKRFYHNSTLQTLYEFVQISINTSLRNFSIITEHPRTVYESYPKNTPLLSSMIPNYTVFIICTR